MLVDFKRPTSLIKYLSSLTSDEWVKLALSNPIDILIDHAHCERKAAGVAIQLIGFKVFLLMLALLLIPRFLFVML